MSPTLHRRSLLAGGLAAATLPAAGGADLIWGVNGHPFTAYPGVAWEAQLDLARDLGFGQYRVNLGAQGAAEKLEAFLDLARARGLVVLPILEPPGDLDRDSPRVLRKLAYDFGRSMAERFRGRTPVWELANELESYAIIQPCERRDDGSQYPCEWGPAGGVGPLEYYGPRWAKVSAVLAGLSQGVARGDPRARRAMGTAGWGHLGAFDRLAADRVAWDITVWHDYQQVSEDDLGRLAAWGKPIWITEFNAGSGAGPESYAENARQITGRIAWYRRHRARYGIAAAFVYELLDEPYWGDTFEARMGLARLEQAGAEDWRIGAVKPAGEAVRAALSAPA